MFRAHFGNDTVDRSLLILGLDNLLVPNWPITEIRSGKPVIVAEKNLIDWLAVPGNKEILLKSLEKWKLK